MKRGDKIIYATIAALIATFALSYFYLEAPVRTNGTDKNPLSGMILEVSVNGKITREILLSEISGEVEIDLNEGGGHNVIRIGREGVVMISSDCPGEDCLRMHPLTSNRGAIVCMPRRLVIRLKKAGTSPADQENLDAVTY